MKPITLVTRVDTYTGYGQNAMRIARGLQANGYEVRIRASHSSEGYSPVPQDIRRMVTTGTVHSSVELIHDAPGILPTPGKRAVYYTMHESTRLPGRAAEFLNKAEKVITPSSWSASCFSANGVTVPIAIVPLGIDSEIFRLPPKQQKSQMFTFGCAGRMAHGPSRKGIDKIVAAFIAAFPTETNVRMLVKTLPDEGVRFNDPRIQAVSSFLSDVELSKFYESLNCFVNIATGGWELHPHEAMSVGTPCICVPFGGNEYFTPQNGVAVEYDLVPSKDIWKGRGIWAEAKSESLISAMRYAYEDPKRMELLGEYAASTVQHLTQENMVAGLIQHLEPLYAGVTQPAKIPSAQQPPVTMIKTSQDDDKKLGIALREIIAEDNVDGDNAILCYLPPDTYPGVKSFVKNIEDNRPKEKMLMFSDSRKGEGIISLPKFVPTGPINSSGYATRNFLQAILLCAARNIKWMLYIETDCRVRNPSQNIHWDEEMFKEHFGWDGAFPICTGTPVSWHYASWGASFASKMTDYANGYKKASGVAMALEGAPAAQGMQPDLYPNGALAIYHIPSLQLIFAPELADPDSRWMTASPFDQQPGKRIVRALGEDVFKHVGFLSSSYSGCSERKFTQAQRLEMLSSGRKVAVHQIKGNA